MNSKLTFAAILAVAFMGCGSPTETVEDEAVDPKDADHVWKTQTDQLDKARQVEDTIQDAAEKRRKQLEDDGG